MITLVSERKIYLGLIAILIIVIAFQRGCGRCPVHNKIVVRDTTYEHHHVSTPIYVPAVSSSTAPSPVKSIRPSPFTLGDFIVDGKSGGISSTIVLHPDNTTAYEQMSSAIWDSCDSIAARYNTINEYRDTVHSEEGSVVIHDKVSRNLILERQVIQHATTSTITITERTADKKHNEIYLGGSIMGGPLQWVQYGGIGLTLKNKRDQLFETEVLTSLNNGGIYWRAGFKTKISFRAF